MHELCFSFDDDYVPIWNGQMSSIKARIVPLQFWSNFFAEIVVQGRVCWKSHRSMDLQLCFHSDPHAEFFLQPDKDEPHTMCHQPCNSSFNRIESTQRRIAAGRRWIDCGQQQKLNQRKSPATTARDFILIRKKRLQMCRCISRLNN